MKSHECHFDSISYYTRKSNMVQMMHSNNRKNLHNRYVSKDIKYIAEPYRFVGIMENEAKHHGIAIYDYTNSHKSLWVYQNKFIIKKNKYLDEHLRKLVLRNDSMNPQIVQFDTGSHHLNIERNRQLLTPSISEVRSRSSDDLNIVASNLPASVQLLSNKRKKYPITRIKKMDSSNSNVLQNTITIEDEEDDSDTNLDFDNDSKYFPDPFHCSTQQSDQLLKRNISNSVSYSSTYLEPEVVILHEKIQNKTNVTSSASSSSSSSFASPSILASKILESNNQQVHQAVNEDYDSKKSQSTVGRGNSCLSQESQSGKLFG